MIRLLLGGVCALALALTIARAAEPYAWSAVAIGGGGYITGQAIHPTTSDVHFVRCDVGGVFRWSAANAHWEPLLDWVTPDQSNLSGCDGLALHPTNPDIVFALLGRYAYNTPAGLYKSTDRGLTWRRVLSTRCAANSDQRWHGEPIAFDPVDPSVVYCGTRTDGVHRSVDGGETWTKLASAPAGDTGSGASDNYATYPIGVRSVLVAPDRSVYLGIYYRSTNSAAGVYRSTDQGATFTQLSGAPARPVRFAADSASRLYVTHDSGVARFESATTTWTDITPPSEPSQRFCGLALDPADDARLLVARYAYSGNLALYSSADRGATWSANLSNNAPHLPEAPWTPSGHKLSAIATLAYDPHHPGAVFYGDWYAVWRSADIDADLPSWTSRVSGLETTVVVNLLCPPASATAGQVPPLVSGFADIIGFRHFDHWRFPEARLTTTDAEGISADYCEAAPQNLAVVTADDWYGGGTRIITSADGGATWTQRGIPSVRVNGTWETVTLGRIVVDRANPAKMAYIPYNLNRIYYTTNTGTSWTRSSSSLGGAVLTKNSIFDYHQPLCADRNTADRMFVYRGGHIYRSTNAGNTWADANGSTAAPLPALDSGNHAVLTSPPGRADELWISIGWQGLWRSTDAGVSFSQISGFANARSISWGKPESGTATIPYVFGSRSGVWGVWRSTDLSTWERISDDAHAFGNETKVIAADRQVYGRVYLGSNGNGIRLGQPWPERTWEQWRQNNFTHAQRVAASDAATTRESDPDADGRVNLLEYAFGGAPAGENLLPAGSDLAANGGFESATLSPWGGGASWGTFSRVTTNPRTGAAALRLERPSACHVVVTGLLAGVTYQATAYIRSESGGPVKIGVKNHGNTERSVASSSAADYEALTLEFTPGVGSSSAELYLYRDSTGSGGAWVDDVTVRAAPIAAGAFVPEGHEPASDPASGEPVLSTTANGARLVLSFDRLRPDLAYEVEASGDLLSWETIANNPGAVNTRVSVEDIVDLATQPRRFLRARVTAR